MRLVAVDAASGEVRWSFKAGDWIFCNPVVHNGRVYIGSQDKYMYCLDAKTGNEIWKFKTAARIEAGGALCEGRLYFGCCAGVVYCVDAKNGHEIWRFSLDQQNGRSNIYCAPLITRDGTLYVAGMEGQVYCLDAATGELRWKIRPSEKSEIDSNLATDGARLFVGTRPTRAKAGEVAIAALASDTAKGNRPTDDQSKPAPNAETEKINAAIRILRETDGTGTQTAQMDMGNGQFGRVAVNDDWAAAIRTLTEIGKPAVPAIAAALDEEDRNHPIRKLAFTLRAIGDPLAMPALIRALPRTLVPSCSDCIEYVEDPELLKFMQKHDLDGGKSGNAFSYGRPFREVVSALRKLSGTNQNDMELNFIFLGKTPAQRDAQRKLFYDLAQRWEQWWSQNWQRLGVGNDYAAVNLPPLKLELSAADAARTPTLPTGPKLGLVDVTSGKIIQSAQESKQRCFIDFDTGRETGWPKELPPIAQLGADQKPIINWADKQGIDLMGITYQPPGFDAPIYCLQPLSMKVWQLTPEEQRSLPLAIRGEIPYPLGHPVDRLVPRKEAYQGPDKNELGGTAFLFLTREGTAGLLRMTAQVTDTNVQSGQRSSPDDQFSPIGFYRGAKISYALVGEVQDPDVRRVGDAHLIIGGATPPVIESKPQLPRPLLRPAAIQPTDKKDGASSKGPNATDRTSANAQPPSKKSSTADEERIYTVPVTISGRTLGTSQQPIAGATVYLASQNPGYKRIAETKSDKDGKYTFKDVPLPIRQGDKPEGDGASFEIFGTADGYGLSWRQQKWYRPNSAHYDNEHYEGFAEHKGDWPKGYGSDDPIELDLQFGPAANVRGRIVDDHGKPIANTLLDIRNADSQWDQDDYKYFKGEGALNSFNEQNTVPRNIKTRKTDADGRFEFTGLPINNRFWIWVHPPGFPTREIWAVTNDTVDTATKGDAVYKGDINLVFATPRKVPIEVIYGDTRKPAPKVMVSTGGAQGASGGSTNDAGLVTATLPDGEYKVRIEPRIGTSYLNSDDKLVVSETSVKKPAQVVLQPAAVVDISVVDADTGKPLAGVDLWRKEPNADAPNGNRSEYGYYAWEVETRISHYDKYRTDNDGKMQVLFAPGKHRIGVGLYVYPDGYQAVDTDGKVVELDAAKPQSLTFQMRKRAQAARDADTRQGANESAPKGASESPKGTSELAKDTNDNKLPQLQRYRVRVVDEAGQPVAGATVEPYGVSSTPELKITWKQTTDSQGIASVPYPRMMIEEYGVMFIGMRVQHRDYVAAQAQVEVGAKETVVKLARGGAVEITAVAADNRGDSGPIYGLVGKLDPTIHWTPKDDGTILSPYLAPGEDVVRAVSFPAKGGALFSEPRQLKIKQDQLTKLNLELRAGWRVEGRLSDQVPRPVQNGRVILRMAGDNFGWSDSTVIREDGTFAFESVPPVAGSKVGLIAICKGFISQPPTAAPDVERKGFVLPQIVPFDNERTQCVVEMIATSQCVVKVVDTKDKPIAGAHVYAGPNLFWEHGSTMFGNLDGTKDVLTRGNDTRLVSDTTVFPYEATTGEDGVAELSNLPPLDYVALVADHEKYELPHAPFIPPVAYGKLVAGKPANVTITMLKRKPSIANAGAAVPAPLPINTNLAKIQLVENTTPVSEKPTAAAPAPAPKQPVPLPVIITKQLLLLDGKQVTTWDEIDRKIAASPDPSNVDPHFYYTNGAIESGAEKVAKTHIWDLSRKFKLNGHSEGTLLPRTGLRYDNIRTKADLIPDESLRVEGTVIGRDNKPVAGAEVVLISPVAESLPYKAYDIALVEGRVRNRLDELVTDTDAAGRFVIYPPKGQKYYVLALHPAGGMNIARGQDFAESRKVQLLAWATLTSELGPEPGAEQSASISTRLEEKDGYPEVSIDQYWSDLKNEKPTSAFVFTHVPPILTTSISRDFAEPDGGSMGLNAASVSLLPGESRRIDLGPLSEKQREWLKSLLDESKKRSDSLRHK